MKKPVIAIGLDSAEPLVLETWMAQGYLKNLSQLRQWGTYGRLNNFVEYCNKPIETSSTERLWVMFLTGCLPHKTGGWESVKYDEKTYGITHGIINGGYDFQEYSPFYALGDDYRVAVFDAPSTVLSERVNGLQILGWGGHAPHTPSHSLPPEILPTLIGKYGKNPVLHKDYGYWWDRAYLDRMQESIKISVERRVAICRDLLKQEKWDLFLTIFGDTHTAGHDFWHFSQPDHPFYLEQKKEVAGSDPMLSAFEEVDRAIGEILASVPEDAYVLVFSVHGMGSNATDTLCMAFLPELLYRFNFPGKAAIASGKLGVTPPPPITHPIRKTWTGQIWQLKYESNPIKRLLRRWAPSKLDKFLDSQSPFDLVSPYKLREQSSALYWNPTMWYQPLWSQMKAFAIPGFSDGCIRINLKGREPNGIVEPSEYDALCNELTEKFSRLTDGRTGKPLVKQVVRTRYSASDCRPNLPDADLVVLWHEQPTDVVDSPDFGRIGPLTYYRTGGHRSQGFLLAKGEGITPGSNLGEAEVVDLAPTILELMGAEIPAYLDGKPVLKQSFEAVSSL
jgi:predicted AlkP superfamily phosphohydrolase/phosphomutase